MAAQRCRLCSNQIKQKHKFSRVNNNLYAPKCVIRAIAPPRVRFVVLVEHHNVEDMLSPLPISFNNTISQFADPGLSTAAHGTDVDATRIALTGNDEGNEN